MGGRGAAALLPPLPPRPRAAGRGRRGRRGAGAGARRGGGRGAGARRGGEAAAWERGAAGALSGTVIACQDLRLPALRQFQDTNTINIKGAFAEESATPDGAPLKRQCRRPRRAARAAPQRRRLRRGLSAAAGPGPRARAARGEGARERAGPGRGWREKWRARSPQATAASPAPLRRSHRKAVMPPLPRFPVRAPRDAGRVWGLPAAPHRPRESRATPERGARSTEPGRAELPQGKTERARKAVLTCVEHRDTVISAPEGLHMAWVFLLRSCFKLIPHSSTALLCWKRVKSDGVRDGAAPPKCDITLSLHVYPQHTVSCKG